MADTATLYTSPNAGTVPGQQYDQNAQFMASMGNGQPMNPQALGAATQATSDATAQLGAMQTPQARGQFVNSGDLPQIQGNYEQLARQLYDTDKAIAASGQFNPNPAPDASSFGSVNASPLELTNSILGGSSFNPVNPGIGMQTQISQQGSIIDLLNALNQSSAKEFNSRKNSYASSVKGQQAIVDTLLSILGKNADLGMNKYNQQQENYRAGLSSGSSASNKIAERANALRTDLATGVLQWGDAWKQLHSEFPNSRPDEIDSYLGGKYDATDPDGSKGLTNGWAVPGAAQDYAQGLRFKQTGTAATGKRAEYVKAVDNIEQQLNGFDQDKLGLGGGSAASAKTKSATNIGPIHIGSMFASPEEQTLIQYQGLLDSLFTTAVATLSSRGATKPDLDALQSLKPDITMPKDLINKKIDSINGLVGKFPDKNINSDQINQATQKLKQAGYNDQQINQYLQSKGLK